MYVWHPGFTCYGVAIGSKGYVNNFLQQKVDKFSADVSKVMDLLKDDRHAAWNVLSTLLSQQFDHSISLH